MPKFYIVELSTEAVGTYPQVQSFVSNCINDVWGERSLYALSAVPIDQFPDFEPELNCLKLETKAKRTSFISSSLNGSDNGWIVDEKVKKIVLSKLCVDIRFFPCPLYQKNHKFNEYFYMYIKSPAPYSVDFSESVFYGENILSHSDYESQREKVGRTTYIFPNKLTVNNPMFLNGRVFILRGLGNWLCISDEVYNDFKSAGVTGIDYRCFEMILAS
ncbi:MAG: hypothetical protein L6Q81_02945 [Bacteroidia bacterium]|nr:hypothetical protein [Bacteroidia bacterium]